VKGFVDFDIDEHLISVFSSLFLYDKVDKLKERFDYMLDLLNNSTNLNNSNYVKDWNKYLFDIVVSGASRSISIAAMIPSMNINEEVDKRMQRLNVLHSRIIFAGCKFIINDFSLQNVGNLKFPSKLLAQMLSKLNPDKSLLLINSLGLAPLSDEEIIVLMQIIESIEDSGIANYDPNLKRFVNYIRLLNNGKYTLEDLFMS
jgi:hypothetical protein